MADRESQIEDSIEAFRAAVDVGMDEIARGKFTEFATGAELAAYLKARRAAPHPGRRRHQGYGK